MNLVEVYLKEIHEEKPYQSEWCKKFPCREFVEVTATWNSYGYVFTKTKIYDVDDWNEIKEQGNYLG